MNTLSAELLNDVLIVEFNNSTQANCFGENEANQLDKILKIKAKGLIFHALSTKVFCSGGNLTDYAKLKTKAQGQKINKKIKTTLQKLSTTPYPTACLVSGDCIGGGIELMSAFDKVYASPQCFFGLWQRKIGLTFGWGGFERLQKRVPVQTLKQLSLDTRSISVYEAKSINLIDDILPKSHLFYRTLEWIERQQNLPQTPISKIKTLNEKYESKIFDSLWMGRDHRGFLTKLKK